MDDGGQVFEAGTMLDVGVDIMELIRDSPLEDALRADLDAAWRAVPGVGDVFESDREVWTIEIADDATAGVREADLDAAEREVLERHRAEIVVAVEDPDWTPERTLRAG